MLSNAKHDVGSLCFAKAGAWKKQLEQHRQSNLGQGASSAQHLDIFNLSWSAVEVICHHMAWLKTWRASAAACASRGQQISTC